MGTARLEVSEVRWDDADAVRRFARVQESARAVDSPWVHPVRPDQTAARLRHGWDGEPPACFLVTAGGVDVAAAGYDTTSYDNQHLAWLGIDVAPEHRRRGHGSDVLGFLLERARTEGRTSVGGETWDQPGPRAFAARHGFEARAVEVNRRQHLARLDRDSLERLHHDALEHAHDYELVRLAGATPPGLLAAMATLAAAINDAPTDDLDIEDEVFPPERIAAYDEAQIGRGHTMLRVLARHRATGELVGQTVVAIEGERPEVAHQHDTSVVSEHRGHRLGLLLKTEMVRWLVEDHPQVATVDTWNAESNSHMVAVNELLGYEVIGRELAWQRPL